MVLAVWLFILFSIRKKPWGTHFQRWGPLYLLTLAIPLIMADNTRHVLQDSGVWKACDRQGIIWDSKKCLWASNQYECTLPGPDHCLPDEMENMKHLSFIGVLFTVVFMYSGFLCLIGGVLWFVHIDKKIVLIGQKCKAICEMRRRAKEREMRKKREEEEKKFGKKELCDPLLRKEKTDDSGGPPETKIEVGQ